MRDEFVPWTSTRPGHSGAGGEKELVGSAPQQRNWRGIAVALFVILMLCLTIFVAILISSFYAEGNGLKTGTPVALQDVIGLSFMSPIESMDWVDAKHIAVRYSDSLNILDVRKQPPVSTTLLDAETLFRHGKPHVVWVTRDRKYVVAGYSGPKKAGKVIFRIYDITDSSFENVGPQKTGDENIQVLAWNPVGNDFAFVHENDIYYQTGPGTKAVQRLTASGNESLLNGVASWLYEEEILQSNKALWWSLDGTQLAFLTIDNALVDHIEFTRFGRTQYPETVRAPYPKTGATHLPRVQLTLWHKTEDTHVRLEVVAAEATQLTYLFSARWLRLHGQNVLVAVWGNRYQNHTTVTLCTAQSGKCVNNLEQRYVMAGMKLWAEPEDYEVRFHSNTSYFLLLPRARQDGNVYTQVARVHVSPDLTTSRVAFLDMGEFDVDKINWFDEHNDRIFFTAAAPKPIQRHLYAVSATPGGAAARCVTCNTSRENCTFHESTFSDDGDHFILNCKGPGTPHVILSSVSSNFSNLAEYGRNPFLEQARRYTQVLPRVHFDNVTLRNGHVAQIKMLLPPNLEMTSLARKYPVLVDVYAGPGTQKATEEWLANGIDIYFASNPEYVIVFIDGRGSGNRGWKSKAPLYGALGTVEVDDQIEALRRLMAKHWFMDKRRVAIWGWSYGGFAAARAVERDTKHTFRCAVSVAPVTHFKFYDATYTERYMGGASKEAYDLTDLSRNVSAFHDVQYLLVHGTGDDNVHFQNTAVFIKALADDNVQFDLSVYTDDAHNLASSRWHLYNKLANFLRRCFDETQVYLH